MLKFRLILAVAAIAPLSACLDTDLERGLVGAAGGAIIANEVGVDPIVGAAAGGAAGALCDNVTSICR